MSKSNTSPAGPKPATALLPPDVLLAVSRLLGASADRHTGSDFADGRPWSDDYAALLRHALAFWAGEDRDPHSGEFHAVHIAARGLLLAAAVMRFPQHDDRPDVNGPSPTHPDVRLPEFTRADVMQAATGPPSA